MCLIDKSQTKRFFKKIPDQRPIIIMIIIRTTATTIIIIIIIIIMIIIIIIIIIKAIINPSGCAHTPNQLLFLSLL